MKTGKILAGVAVAHALSANPVYGFTKVHHDDLDKCIVDDTFKLSTQSVRALERESAQVIENRGGYITLQSPQSSYAMNPSPPQPGESSRDYFANRWHTIEFPFETNLREIFRKEGVDDRTYGSMGIFGVYKIKVCKPSTIG